MTAGSAAAQRAVLELLEAPARVGASASAPARAAQGYVDPGAVAAQAVAAAPPPRAAVTAQRGRTGKVSWDASKHKRGWHGRFAPGSQQEKNAQAQQTLQQHGLYKGQIDGQAGPQTQAAIKAFQQRYGLSPTGRIDSNTAATLAAPPPKTLAQVKADEAKLAAGKTRTGSRSSSSRSRSARSSAASGSRSARSSGTSGTTHTRTASTGRISGGTAAAPGNANWQGNLSASGVLRAGDGLKTKQGKDASRGNAEVQLLQAKLQELGFDLGAAGTDGKFGTATQAAVKAFQRHYGLTPDGVVGGKTKLLLNLLSSVTEQKPQPGKAVLSIDQMPLSRPPRGASAKRAQLQTVSPTAAAQVAEAATRTALGVVSGQ